MFGWFKSDPVESVLDDYDRKQQIAVHVIKEWEDYLKETTILYGRDGVDMDPDCLYDETGFRSISESADFIRKMTEVREYLERLI